MGKTDAEYKVIDPQAKGLEAVERAFLNQVAYCQKNAAPNTALICHALFELLDGERGGAVMKAVREWKEAPLADALPLRVAGGLHALHLAGKEAALAPIYAGSDPEDASDRVAHALETHEDELLPWLDGPPQTNEAGRSWGFAAAMLWLAARGLPARFVMHELGSSAGINLMMKHFAFDLAGVEVGPADSPIALKPEWRGDPPPQGSIEIASIRGCDVAPVDLRDPEQALRLKAYVWPELAVRLERMDQAIRLAHAFPPDMARMKAGEFVDVILDHPAQEGTTRVIFHSVVWQYIPSDEQRAITAAIESAGAAASEDAPLAWITLEANRDTHRHELRVRYWPGGDEEVCLATAHPHGAWVNWYGG